MDTLGYDSPDLLGVVRREVTVEVDSIERAFLLIVAIVVEETGEVVSSLLSYYEVFAPAYLQEEPYKLFGMVLPHLVKGQVEEELPINS